MCQCVCVCVCVSGCVVGLYMCVCPVCHLFTRVSMDINEESFRMGEEKN